MVPGHNLLNFVLHVREFFSALFMLSLLFLSFLFISVDFGNSHLYFFNE